MPPAALIETVRVRAGVAPLWGLHLRRLALSCRDLGIPFPRGLAVPRGGADRVRRLQVDAHGVQVSERAVGDTTPVRLVTAREPHRPYPHKTTARDQFERALAEALGAGADDALLLTPGGLIAEAAVWGIFWWEGDRLCAPALDLGVLPGVARARLAVMAGGIAERRLGVAELAGHALFLANAARGVVPIASLDGHEVSAAPGTGALAARFWG